MKADVIVIGVGAMGSAACLELARAGHKVLGLEQFDLVHALGSSHGETRVIRKAYFEHPDYVPLLERSYQLWSRLEFEAGRRLYRETGLIYFCPSGSRLSAGILASSRRYGIEVQSLDAAARRPFSRWFREENFADALFEPGAGFLRVEACVEAQISEARRHGAEIRPREAVTSWTADSRSARVQTSTGETHEADRLVFTAGAWMSRVLADLKLPLRVLRKVLYWLPAQDERFSHEHGMPCYLMELPSGVFYGFPALAAPATGPRLLKLAQHSGGSAVTDPSRVNRELEPGEEQAVLSFAETSLRLPEAERRIVRHAVCMYTSTPDENFILDLHPEHPNVVVASCCSGHGFKFAPVIGEAIRDLALEGRSALPIGFLSSKKLS